ncbi:hypothetical protein Drose_25740 [Dactylosporangium roseum]|uniref:Uncharacterized protein n=1 Tax=Dactylosporangium roseum TaxID=47989 RepID=A0ABY5YXX8_9ACTN|nr:hypothetical protein [Dactylosporangium roseum]UWZ34611.1 hypothetical protein Drose_25740 [Dactylosporangium roseum]
MTARVFPVGHYLGGYPDEADAPDGGFEVRIGSRVVPLHGPAELAVWALAHQPPDAPFEATLADLFGPVGHDLADGLVARGALAPVALGDTPPAAADGDIAVAAVGAEGVAFAHGHRLRPLQTAIGWVSGADGGGFAIGFAGQATVVVGPLLRDLWWWAGPSTDLWGLCQRLAAARESTPEQVLRHFLDHGHHLLAAGAAYLDAV